jgi:hypothetical protein
MAGLYSMVWTTQESFCHFFLDKKVTKKSSLSNASMRNAIAPLAGQAGQHSKANKSLFNEIT